jgi:hypothetical protein
MKNYFLFLTSFLMVFIAKLIPFSLIVGSQSAFFSASTSMAMVIARHSGFWVLFFFILPMKSLSVVQLFFFLLNRTPLFFASWSYRSSNVLVSVLIPFLCFLLFIAHPVGIDAWPYTLYWLIPIIIYFLNYKNIALRALGAVFVAHAVGSVIWIYSHPMTSQVWLALIPIVAVERLLMVFGVLAGEYVVENCKSLHSKITLFCGRKVA